MAAASESRTITIMQTIISSSFRIIIYVYAWAFIFVCVAFDTNLLTIITVPIYCINVTRRLVWKSDEDGGGCCEGAYVIKCANQWSKYNMSKLPSTPMQCGICPMCVKCVHGEEHVVIIIYMNIIFSRRTIQYYKAPKSKL